MLKMNIEFVMDEFYVCLADCGWQYLVASGL